METSSTVKYLSQINNLKHAFSKAYYVNDCQFASDGISFEGQMDFYH